MDFRDLDAAAVNSLADRLAGLDLTAAEHAVLDAILDRARQWGSEVEAFSLDGLSAGPSSAMEHMRKQPMGARESSLKPGVGSLFTARGALLATSLGYDPDRP